MKSLGKLLLAIFAISLAQASPIEIRCANDNPLDVVKDSKYVIVTTVLRVAKDKSVEPDKNWDSVAYKADIRVEEVLVGPSTLTSQRQMTFDEVQSRKPSARFAAGERWVVGGFSSTGDRGLYLGLVACSHSAKKLESQNPQWLQKLRADLKKMQ